MLMVDVNQHDAALPSANHLEMVISTAGSSQLPGLWLFIARHRGKSPSTRSMWDWVGGTGQPGISMEFWMGMGYIEVL